MSIITILLIVITLLGTVLAFRLNLASYLPKVLLPELGEQQAKIHQFTEASQKEAIAALEARMEVLEANIDDMVTARTKSQKELAELHVSSAKDQERITQLETSHIVDAQKISDLTVERDALREQVYEQAVTIVGLTARVLELEKHIYPGEPNDRPELLPVPSGVTTVTTVTTGTITSITS